MKSNTPSAFEFTDFRGGYCSDVPNRQMVDTELLTADNCYWRDGITSRGGKASYASISGCGIRGGIRARIKDVWYTIVAASTTASGVLLKIGTDTAYSNLTYPSATVAQLASTYAVQFCYLDNKVVAVNGSDKPHVIYQMPSATNVIDTMESYDTRYQDDADWKAGQVHATATGTFIYVDDTTAAQDDTTADFSIASTTVTSGWWAACNGTFNKVRLFTCEAIATTSFTYSYYGHASMSASGTWVSFTPITVPTWTAAGDKVVEMNWPVDPTTGEGLMLQFPSVTAGVADDLAGRFAIRAVAVDIPSASAANAAYLKLDHTQYLTQICLDDRPDTVATHKSHIFLGMGNWMRVGRLNQVTGWEYATKEYFSEGGFIQQMLTHGDYLAILLDNAIFSVTGNSWENWATKFLTAERGAAGKRGAVVVGDELYFMARDGIYSWNGSRLLKVSKHIRSDIEGEDASTAVATDWKGEAWFSFPTSGKVYLFDPDTIRQDDAGDGRVSFYRFPTYTTSLFLSYDGAEDNGYFMGVRNLAATAPRLERLESDDVDYCNGATATIPVTLMTRYLDFGNPHQPKTFRRIKVKVMESTSTAGSVYNLRFYRQDKFGGASYSVATITAGAGSDEYIEEMALPPATDGKAFSLYINHDSQAKAYFLGFAIEVEGRKF